jgi:hypothetical protein
VLNNNNNKPFLFFLLTASTFLCLAIESAYAHIPQDNKASPVQEWKDQLKNIKIQFSYSPDKPLLYNTTDLKFSMQDLKTGNHIRDLIASITITKGDKIFFKFNNVAIQDGDLSLKVKFSEDGNYQVISQVRSKDNIGMALASFNIFVPLQPFGKFNANYLTSSLIPAGLVAIGLSALVIVFIIISRKKEKAKRSTDRET